MKPTLSQLVEIKKTKGILQQVESDATSAFLERSVPLEIIPMVTQSSDHVTDQDTDDNEDQGQVISDVHESIVVGRTRRNSRKPSWLTTDIIAAYALPVVEKATPSYIGKLKSVQSPRCERMPC